MDDRQKLKSINEKIDKLLIEKRQITKNINNRIKYSVDLCSCGNKKTKEAKSCYDCYKTRGHELNKRWQN